MRLLRIELATLPILWLSGLVPAAQATVGPSWKKESNQPRAGFGSSVSGAGDVNGDGFADVIIAAHLFNGGLEREGRAFVFHGSALGLAQTPAWTADSNQALATIQGVAAAGDVNGDGFGDVIFSSDYSNGERGEGIAWLFHGSAAGLGVSPAWAVEGNRVLMLFGSSLASGDFNGDKYGDVIVAAPGFSNPQESEGTVFVYLGSAAGLSTSPVWSVEGNQRFAGFGTCAAGDFNGDGYSDVVVGAGNHGFSGRVFVYMGSASGPSASPDWIAVGDQVQGYFGSSVSAGDVNGDGHDDLIVGTPLYSVEQGRIRTFLGRVTVYLGSATGLSTSPAWTLTGVQRSSGLGLVSSAGDLDGDGFDDVILGMEDYNGTQRNEGRVVAYFGSPAGLASRTRWIAEADQPFAKFGGALSAAGDVNGDGYGDVVIGAYFFNGGQPDEGRAFLYHGSPRHRLK